MTGRPGLSRRRPGGPGRRPTRGPTGRATRRRVGPETPAIDRGDRLGYRLGRRRRGATSSHRRQQGPRPAPSAHASRARTPRSPLRHVQSSPYWRSTATLRSSLRYEARVTKPHHCRSARPHLYREKGDLSNSPRGPVAELFPIPGRCDDSMTRATHGIGPIPIVLCNRGRSDHIVKMTLSAEPSAATLNASSYCSSGKWWVTIFEGSSRPSATRARASAKSLRRDSEAPSTRICL